MIPALSHRNRPYVLYSSALPWRDNWENMLLEGFLLSLTPLPLFQEKGKAPFCPTQRRGAGSHLCFLGFLDHRWPPRLSAGMRQHWHATNALLLHPVGLNGRATDTVCVVYVIWDLEGQKPRNHRDPRGRREMVAKVLVLHFVLQFLTAVLSLLRTSLLQVPTALPQ